MRANASEQHFRHGREGGCLRKLPRGQPNRVLEPAETVRVAASRVHVDIGVDGRLRGQDGVGVVALRPG